MSTLIAFTPSWLHYCIFLSSSKSSLSRLPYVQNATASFIQDLLFHSSTRNILRPLISMRMYLEIWKERKRERPHLKNTMWMAVMGG